jgi:tRNA(fMet)-specific endonuclease VapC
MLDTNICIYIMKNRPEHIKEKLKTFNLGDVYLSSVVVSELYYGVYKSVQIERNLVALEHFLKPFNIVDYDLKASVEYGKIRGSLEKAGKAIGGLDMLIAAHARSLGLTLVTNNTKEFERIESLEIDNWV